MLCEEPDETGYYSFEPRNGYQLVRDLPEMTIIWKKKFILVCSLDRPHAAFTLPQDPSLEPLGIRRVGLTVKEEFLLQSFSATRPRVPLFLEIINIQSLEEHDLALIPHQRDMPLHCFELYGLMGVVERLKPRRLERSEEVCKATSSASPLF
ncbi:hypothetical protein Dimus_023249 [Dionaea muscipula]